MLYLMLIELLHCLRRFGPTVSQSVDDLQLRTPTVCDSYLLLRHSKHTLADRMLSR